MSTVYRQANPSEKLEKRVTERLASIRFTRFGSVLCSSCRSSADRPIPPPVPPLFLPCLSSDCTHEGTLQWKSRDHILPAIYDKILPTWASRPDSKSSFILLRLVSRRLLPRRPPLWCRGVPPEPELHGEALHPPSSILLSPSPSRGSRISCVYLQGSANRRPALLRSCSIEHVLRMPQKVLRSACLERKISSYVRRAASGCKRSTKVALCSVVACTEPWQIS